MQQKSSGETARKGVRRVRINEDLADQRIDNFLLRELPGVPKGRIYRLLRKGEVRVNGGRIKAEYRLSEGDEVRIPPVRLEEKDKTAPPAVEAARMAERILYEDRRLLVVDKPAGVAVHGGSGVSFGVVEYLRHSRPELKDLALAHRIDRETSGVLVLAKKRSALRSLHELFREGKVDKHYLALAAGDWQFGEQVIDAPLLVTNRQGGERHVVVSDKGKPAQTTMRLSRTFGKASLLNCSPHTGRTHQIRVHAAHAGHPLVGDERYGDPEINALARKGGLKRLFLHAQSIAFPDDHGNELHFTAPIADDLQRFLDKGVSGLSTGRKLRQDAGRGGRPDKRRRPQGRR